MCFSGQIAPTMESPASLSPAPSDVCEIQKQVKSQAAEIEKYIAIHDATEMSEAFSVLKSLFGLFKSEVSMNISFRKAISKERKLRREAEAKWSETESFFTEFSRFMKCDVHSFPDIFDAVANWSQQFVTKNTQLKKNVRRLKQRIHVLEEEIANRDQIPKAQKNEDLIENLKTQLKNSVCEAEGLKVELADAMRVIQKQRKAIHIQDTLYAEQKRNAKEVREAVKEGLRKKKEEAKAKEKELALKAMEVAAKLDEMDKTCKGAMERQQHENEQKMAILKRHYEEEKAKQQLDFQQRMVLEQTEREKTIERIDAELEMRDVEIQDLKQEMLRLSEMTAVLSEELKRKDEEIHSWSAKLQYVTAEKEKIRLKNSKLVEKNEEQASVIDILTAKLSSLQSEYAYDQEEFAYRMKELKLKHKERVDSLGEEVESRLVDKMKAIEARIKRKEGDLARMREELEAAGRENADLKKALCERESESKMHKKVASQFECENERLRNMMREKVQVDSELVLSEFQRLYDILQVDRNAPPHAVVEAVSNLLPRLGKSENL